MSLVTIIEWIERLVGWLERTPWGRHLVSFALTAALSAWVWLTAHIPASVIVALAVLLFAAITFLLGRALQWTAVKLQPTMLVQCEYATVGLTEQTVGMLAFRFTF